MPTVLSRVYSDKKQAQEAVDALKEIGVLERDIDVLSLGDAGLDAKADDDTIKAALAKVRVFSKQGPAYVEALKKKRTIVVVAAPLGASAVPRRVLDSMPSLDVGVPNELHVEAGQLPPTRRRPTANAVLLDKRMMTKDGLTDWSLSSMLKMPELSGGRKARKSGLINGTITGKMGMKMLTERKTKTQLIDGLVSDEIGVPTLVKGPGY